MCCVIKFKIVVVVFIIAIQIIENAKFIVIIVELWDILGNV